VELSAPALRAATALSRHLPLAVTTGIGRTLSFASAHLSRDQRLMVERNLRRVRPEAYVGPLGQARLHRDVQRVFDSYSRYWVDLLRLPHLSDDHVLRGFRGTGIDQIEDSITRGIGPILALPHLGGWEWAARWLSVSGHRVAAVAEELEPPELNEWFLGIRRDLGMNIITLGPGAATESGAAILSGQVMCLLCDRDLAATGIEVEFFGERTTLPGGPALLALRTGAPLFPTAVYFEASRCHGYVSSPLDTQRRGRLRDDVHRVTQDLAVRLEELIARAPEQWHLMVPNWPSDHEALGHPMAGASGNGSS
jgi:phosphatidylinositol dimannoside acyltransferase